jgi:hypothetical protein
MVPTAWHERSVRNYHSTPHKIPKEHAIRLWIPSLVTSGAEVWQRTNLFQRALHLFLKQDIFMFCSRASGSYSSHNKSRQWSVNSSYGVVCWSYVYVFIDMYHIQPTTFIWTYRNKKIITTSWGSLIEHTQSPACRMVRLATTWMDFMHWKFVNVYSVCTYTVLCSAFSGRLGFLATLLLHILCSLYWGSALVIRLSHFSVQTPLKEGRLLY